MIDFTGTLHAAAHCGDPKAEYAAAREDATVFDLSDRSQVVLSGRDRQSFLHNFCTNKVKSLQPGQGCEAFVTSGKGRILVHIFVFVDRDVVWVESVPGAAEPLIAHLSRYCITEDVTWADRTADFGELLVSGPRAAERLGRLVPGTDTLARYSYVAAVAGGDTVQVRRVDWLGPTGLLLSAPRKRLAELRDQLVASGIRPAGTEAFHALRIEAGFPLYGRDLTEDHLGQEAARTPLAISFKKGCYLGQEPLARLHALGHVNRELRGLRLQSGPVPEAGASVLATDQDKPIGHITSSALSYADDRPVALAYLKRTHTAPGTVVAVQSGDERHAATVFWNG